eukprot:6647392-Prymnesium_polylepis.1
MSGTMDPSSGTMDSFPLCRVLRVSAFPVYVLNFTPRGLRLAGCGTRSSVHLCPSCIAGRPRIPRIRVKIFTPTVEGAIVTPRLAWRASRLSPIAWIPPPVRSSYHHVR